MSKTAIIVALTGSALIAGMAHGQILVEILDMPAEVPSFGPLFVLFAVENTGEAPIYLPAAVEEPGNGPALYLAPEGELPRRRPLPVASRLFPHAGGTMWLAPGERWLFYYEIGGKYFLPLEGVVSIQAVMLSLGRCGDRQEYGRHSFPLEPLYLETFSTGFRQFPVFRCWEGEVRSSIRNVTIRKPTSAIDDEAFEYLLAHRGVRHSAGAGAWQLRAPYDFHLRFPASLYAYADLALAGGGSQRRAVELHPDHPLNPWVNGRLAQQVLDRRSTCWKHAPFPFEIDIDELEVPDGVREYLEQYEWYLENRHCPNQRAEEQRRKELEERIRQESDSESDPDAGGGQ
jgi:hypothetical protein